MSVTKRTTLREVAIMVGDVLRRHGIRAVLTGGACATIHSQGWYTSSDVDFILEGQVQRARLDRAMATLGFLRKGDRYVHSRSDYWVEFPRGPLAVGGDHDVRAVVLRTRSGTTLALSATDSCRDRLAAFYHWADRQSLRTAVEIAARKRVNFRAMEAWSLREGHSEDFSEFLREVRETKRRRRISRPRPSRTR